MRGRAPSPGAHPNATPKGTPGTHAERKPGARVRQSRCLAPRFHGVPHKRVLPSLLEAASQEGKTIPFLPGA